MAIASGMTNEGQKFYDHERGRPIDPAADACSFDAWRINQPQGALFARHPEGFMVFLPGNVIARRDEYLDADPYGVEQALTSPFHRRRVDVTGELLREALAESGEEAPRILDLGCGQGHITASLRAAFPAAEWSALDDSLTAIGYAHRNHQGIDFVLADACKAPFAPGYFDVAICNNLWEHLPDPLRALERISLVLRPAGHLVLSTPSRYRLPNLMAVLKGRPVTLLSTHHVTEYTVGQIKEQLDFGGFTVCRTASRPLRLPRFRGRLAMAAFSAVVRLTRSEHCLESTVFFLARKISGSRERRASDYPGASGAIASSSTAAARVGSASRDEG